MIMAINVDLLIDAMQMAFISVVATALGCAVFYLVFKLFYMIFDADKNTKQDKTVGAERQKQAALKRERKAANRLKSFKKSVR